RKRSDGTRRRRRRTMNNVIRKSALITGVAMASFGLGSFTQGKVPSFASVVSLGRALQTEAGPTLAAPASAVRAPAAETASASSKVERQRGMGAPSFASLVESVSPAVVHVKVVSAVPTADSQDSPFGQDFPFPGFRWPMPPPSGRRQGTGSGFVIR